MPPLLSRTPRITNTQNLALKAQKPAGNPFAAEAKSPFRAFSPRVPSPLKAAAAAPVPLYSTPKGQFLDSSQQRVQELSTAYLTAKASGLAKPPKGEARVATTADMAFDFQTASASDKLAVIRDGAQTAPSHAVYVSAAGLWARGYNKVKALMPVNLSECVTKEETLRLVELSTILDIKDAASLLFHLKHDVPPRSTIEKEAAKQRKQHQAEYDGLINRAMEHPSAINSVDLHIARVAVASKAAGKPIQLVLNTSEQTHSALSRYAVESLTNYTSKKWSDDAGENAKIVATIGQWRKSDSFHLFGYQENIPAFHQETGQPLQALAKIGEGAGTHQEYLENSGLAATLASRGVTKLTFSNIEVQADLLGVIGAHGRAGMPMSMVVVDSQATGGNPMMVRKPYGGTFIESLESHEAVNMPENLKKQRHHLLNTNTLTMPLWRTPAQRAAAADQVGFETKRDAETGLFIARTKRNAADNTHNTPTAGIRGDNSPNFYSNLKTIQEFLADGPAQLAATRGLLVRDVNLSRP